jgi:hypothetical protein
MRPLVGAIAANIAALSITACGNLAAHRRLDRGTTSSHVHELELVAAGSWIVAVTATTLAVLAGVTLVPGWLPETLAALAAGLLVSIGRFVVLRALVVRHTPTERALAVSRTGRGGRT